MLLRSVSCLVGVVLAFASVSRAQHVDDQRLLLATYNEAAARYNRTAKDSLATWSNSVIALK